jgi:hypothetical protein
MLVLDLSLLLNLTICLYLTLEGLWVKYIPTTKGKGLALFLFLVTAGCTSFGFSFTFPFCLPGDGFGQQSFIGFL